MAPSDFATAGCFFMLREVEISSARAGHVRISSDKLSASWLLPTSKTEADFVTLGCSMQICCFIDRPADRAIKLSAPPIH